MTLEGESLVGAEGEWRVTWYFPPTTYPTPASQFDLLACEKNTSLSGLAGYLPLLTRDPLLDAFSQL